MFCHADEEAELLNPTLLFERCQLLLKEERHEDFIMKAKLLFTRHFVHIRNRFVTFSMSLFHAWHNVRNVLQYSFVCRIHSMTQR
jgi:hypothetical protein